MSELTDHVASGRSIDPVVIEISGDHAYKDRGKHRSGCGFVMPDGSTCMAAMFATQHLSLPLSLNVVGSRGGHFTYKTSKSAWEQVIHDELVRTGLPRGWSKPKEGFVAEHGTTRLTMITVEARLCFPVARFARDQGNFRWFLEKCLGDCLDRGGWLEDDSIYPVRRYEFGGLEIEHRPGEAWTRMMLFPSV